MLKDKQKKLMELEAHRSMLKKELDEKKEQYSKIYAEYLALYREVKILQVPTKKLSKKDDEIKSYIEDADCLRNMINYTFDAIIATSTILKSRKRYADKEISIIHIVDLKPILLGVISNRLKISTIRTMAEYSGGLDHSNLKYDLFAILAHPLWIKKLFAIS